MIKRKMILYVRKLKSSQTLADMEIEGEKKRDTLLWWKKID